MTTTHVLPQEQVNPQLNLRYRDRPCATATREDGEDGRG